MLAGAPRLHPPVLCLHPPVLRLHPPVLAVCTLALCVPLTVCAPLRPYISEGSRWIAGTDFCCCDRYLGGKIELVIKGKKVTTTAADVLLVASTLLALPMRC